MRRSGSSLGNDPGHGTLRRRASSSVTRHEDHIASAKTKSGDCSHHASRRGERRQGRGLGRTGRCCPTQGRDPRHSSSRAYRRAWPRPSPPTGRYQPRPGSCVFGRPSGQARALECSRHGAGIHRRPPSGQGCPKHPPGLLEGTHDTNAYVVVRVRGLVVVPVGRSQVLRFVVPRPAPQHTSGGPIGLVPTACAVRWTASTRRAACRFR